MRVGPCGLSDNADAASEKAKVVDVLNEVMPQIEQFVEAQLAKVPETPPISVTAPVLAPEPALEAAALAATIETDSIPPQLVNETIG